MSAIRFPTPLTPGDTIGVTSPSSGITPDLRPRFDHCAGVARARGFNIREGQCLMTEDIVSAPAAARADELMRMLLDPNIHAVIPPWGGELLINILPALDFKALARAAPKWFAGWSDCTTFTLPLLLLTGSASLHGMSFMDLAFTPAPGAAWWRDVLALQAGEAFTQTSLTHYQDGFKRYEDHPRIDSYDLNTATRWRVLGNERPVSATGRLVGGCNEVIHHLIGTPYADIVRFAHDCAPDGLLVFLENCESTPAEAARTLHQFKLAGWFKHANAVLLGRSMAPQGRKNFSQHDAIADALGDLDIPVIYDMDIGHQPPQHLLINGARARVRYEAGSGALDQALA